MAKSTVYFLFYIYFFFKKKYRLWLSAMLNTLCRNSASDWSPYNCPDYSKCCVQTGTGYPLTGQFGIASRVLGYYYYYLLSMKTQSQIPAPRDQLGDFGPVTTSLGCCEDRRAAVWDWGERRIICYPEQFVIQRGWPIPQKSFIFPWVHGLTLATRWYCLLVFLLYQETCCSWLVYSLMPTNSFFCSMATEWLAIGGWAWISCFPLVYIKKAKTYSQSCTAAEKTGFILLSGTQAG